MCQHYLHKADFSLTETLFKQKTFAIRKNKMDLLIRANKHLLEIWIICKKRPTGWQSSVGGLLFYVFMNMVDLVAKAILSGYKHLWQINEPFVCNKEIWDGLVRGKT